MRHNALRNVAEAPRVVATAEVVVDLDTIEIDGRPQLDELDDGQLITMARDGHQDAFGVLFARYSYAGRRLARHLGQGEDADDVVSEAFAQILDLLRRGKGPDRAFRAYLFTSIRHESGRRAKARQRVMPTDDDAQIDTAVPFGNGQLDQFEKTAVRAAYESLPDRWRTVLWHLDVEGRKPHELGPLMDLTPNSVSALVYRARAGLRDDLEWRCANPQRRKITPMVQSWLLIVCSLAYIGLLFGVAYFGERRMEQGRPLPHRALIFSLSLGVYCTSWTYYGAVGTAVTGGWKYLAIYLGPILTFLLGYHFLPKF